jgi:biopolymer transport protein ExbB
MINWESMKANAGSAVRIAVAALVLAVSAPAFAQDAAAPAPAAPADATVAPAPADTTAAAPAAAPAGEPLAAEPETQMVENKFSPRELIIHSDWVTRSVLILLTVMSIGTWYLLIVKLVEQSRLSGQATKAEQGFWTASSVQDGAGRLDKESAFRMIVEDGLRSAEHHEGTMTDQIDLHEWVTMSLQRSVESINGRLQSGLAFLASVGSTSPFIGLFGTVWGILNALVSIAIAGQASIDKIAGPVGEALYMTAYGLFVAVPAVLFYNWLLRRNKVIMDRVRNFAADLHAVLIGASKVGKSAAARSA